MSFRCHPGRIRQLMGTDWLGSLAACIASTRDVPRIAFRVSPGSAPREESRNLAMARTRSFQYQPIMSLGRVALLGAALGFLGCGDGIERGSVAVPERSGMSPSGGDT